LILFLSFELAANLVGAGEPIWLALGAGELIWLAPPGKENLVEQSKVFAYYQMDKLAEQAIG
jgi:hypothetical protein